MPTALELVFLNETDEVVSTTEIEHRLRQTLERLRTQTRLQASGSIGRLITEIVFVGDQKIQALNAQFRGVDAPTDVLSFARGDDTPEVPASIVVSVETAKRQAKLAGWSLNQELQSLINHGFLHVLGFSHN
jgi:probable rRNA maturation factor